MRIGIVDDCKAEISEMEEFLNNFCKDNNILVYIEYFSGGETLRKH